MPKILNVWLEDDGRLEFRAQGEVVAIFPSGQFATSSGGPQPLSQEEVSSLRAMLEEHAAYKTKEAEAKAAYESARQSACDPSAS